MTAYYNDSDSYVCQWLRNLIKAGLIADGEVDERSIKDVRPDDLRGFSQCHFFAGIGGWSAALRLAGVPDDYPVWTGSCPCQPFSVAGKKQAHADERHLWPAFFSLISQCRPVTVFGEQVAGSAGLAWLDHVRADLESVGYAAAAADIPAASVGAPHIRQRLWWVAQSDEGERGPRRPAPGRAAGTQSEFARRSVIGGVADRDLDGCKIERRSRILDREREIFRDDIDGRRPHVGVAEPAVAGSQGNADQPADAQCAPAERSRDVGKLGDPNGQRESAFRGIQAWQRTQCAGSVNPVADTMHAGWTERRTKSGDGQTAGSRLTSSMADADGGHPSAEREQCSREQRQQQTNSGAGGVADAEYPKRGSVHEFGQDGCYGENDRRKETHCESGTCSEVCSVADASSERRQQIPGSASGNEGEDGRRQEGDNFAPGNGENFWSDIVLLPCSDGKARPTKPGLFPLAHGVRNRVGRLRAYGNAIVPQVAAEFVKAYLEVVP